LPNLPRKPLSQAKITAILKNNPKVTVETKPTEKDTNTMGETKLFEREAQTTDYDTLQPVETLREFGKFLRDVISRYDGNYTQIGELNLQTVDLLHFIELGEEADPQKANETYFKLRELSRERRKLKDENRLLETLYNYIKTNQCLLSQLSSQQGYCAQQRDAIAKQAYNPRTDILMGLLGEKDGVDESC
jgi:hypothetical protein